MKRPRAALVLGVALLAAASAGRTTPLSLEKVAAFQQQAAATAGEAFGGVWLDGAEARVGVVADADGAQDLRDRARAEGLEPVHADYSLRALDEATARITRDVDALIAEGFPIVAIGPDLAANRVLVTVDGDPAGAGRTLRDRYGPAVLVERGAPLRFASHPTNIPCAEDRTWCPPYMRGGLRLSDLAKNCTSGVVARKGERYGMLTAGHCFANGAAVFHGYQTAGEVTARSLGGTVDGEFVVGDPPEGSLLPTNWVYYSNTNNHRSMSSVAVASSEVVGQTICKAGAQTSGACGQITAVGVTLLIEGITLTQQRKTNLCVEPGDSGGPFLNAGVFHGLISAGSTSPSCVSTYSAAENILSVLGASLVTRNPQPV